jgi:hypothetical protein
MTRRNLIPILATVMALAFGVVSSAEASINLNSSRSNIYKTAPDCTKAGGTWGKGRDGVGCYLPVPAKPAAGGKATPK